MTELLVRRSGSRALGPYRLVRRGSRALGGGGLVSAGSGGGGAPAAVGGAALLTDEANGFAADFTYATDANRVAVKETLGPELVTNGGFDSDTGWTPGVDWTISGGVATKAPGGSTSLTQTVAGTVVGQRYKCLITVNVTAAGALIFYVSGTAAGATITASGTYTSYIVATASTLMTLSVTGPLGCTVDNISVKEVVSVGTTTTTEYAVDAFFANAGTSPKQIYYPSGALDWQAHNFLTRSQEFDQGNWPKSGATIGANAVAAPDGTLTADAFIPNAGTAAAYMSQIPAAVALTAYTFSAYVKNGTLGTNWFQLSVTSTSTWRAWFNLATGAKGSSAGTPQSWNITDVGGGWYRVDMSVIPGTTTASCFLIANTADGSTGTVTGNGSSPAFYVWGAQLSRGSAVLAYLPTLNAVRIGLAIDHDPATSPATPRGLLCEPQATNLLLHSSAFDAAQWVKTAATLATNAVAAPNGTLGGDGIVPNAGSVTAAVTQVVTTVAATAYTFSAYIMNGPLSPPWVQVRLTSTGVWSAWFNLATGVKGSSAGSPTSWNIRSVGNGWYRLDVTATAGTTSTTIDVFARSADLSEAAITGDGTSAAFYLWGAQFETGTVPTTSIPTFTATATRVEEKITFTPASINYSATAGSWVAEAVPISTVGYRIIGFVSGTATPSYISSATVLAMYDGAFTNKTVPSVFGAHRTGAAFAAGDRAFTADGAAIVTDAGSTTNLLSPGANIGFGSTPGVSTSTGNMHIRQVTYVPRRMANAELQAETVLDGGAGLIAAETDGFATDFLYATDAKRVAVKAASVTTEYGLDAFYANAGTSPKQVYDVAGTLVWSPHNMCLQSDNFTATWAVGSGVPVITAHTIQDNEAGAVASVQQALAGFIVGETYIVAAWFLKDAVTTRVPALYVQSTGIQTTQLNTSTGAKHDITATLPGAVSAVEDTGAHWKLTVTFVSQSTALTVRFYPAHSTALGAAAANAAVGTITVDKVQVNRGSVPTAYLPTTTAARNGMALDHDPVTHAAKGLLCEPAGTNLVTSSLDFNTGWTSPAGGVTKAKDATGPFGANSAMTLTVTAGSASHWLYFTIAGGTYRYSLYAKAGTINWISIGDGSGPTNAAFFNVSAGTVGTVAGRFSAGTIEAVGNGWYRCSATVTAGSGFFHIAANTSDNQALGWTATGSETVLICQAQAETGTVATSPIPTFAASVTRAGDNYNFLLSTIPALGAEWSLYAQFLTPTITSGRYAVALSDGTGNEVAGIRAASATGLAELSVLDGGVQQAFPSGGLLVANTSRKVAGRVKLNDVQVAGNGVLGVVDTAATIPTLTEVRFGSISSGGTVATFCVQQLSIVPRAWTNVELQAKST